MRLLPSIGLIAALAFAACDGDHSPPTPAAPSTFPTASASAAVATIVPAPIATPARAVTGPFTKAEAFRQEILFSDVSWEMDIVTGEVYVVKPPQRPGSGHVQQGLGPDSADGVWRAVTEGFDVVVTRGKEPAYLVTSTSMEGWSARGTMLYVRRINACGREDVYVLDVESGSLRNLSTAAEPLELSWSPNGAYIALHMLSQSRAYEVVLIDTASGVLRPLVAGPSMGGELIPLGWSADSRRVSLYYNPGRDFCDLADPPTPLPETRVEVTAR